MTAGRDGRIVLTGPEASGRLLVVRLRRDGARDRSFSANGVAAVPLQGTAPEGGAGIGVFRDDRVFVAATLVPRLPGAPTRIVVARLLPDGSLDPSFGRGGKAVVGPPGARVDTMRLTYQGLMVIGGAVGETPLLLRLQPDGTRDPGFGDPVLPGPGRVRDVSVLRDLRMAAAIGTDPAGPGPDDLRVARLTPAGALDPAFAGTGLVGVPGTGAIGRGLGTAAVLLHKTGGVTLAGNSLTPARTVLPLLLRLGADGALDTAFGSGGFVRLPLRDGFRVAALARDRRGRLLVAGRTAPPRAALYRLTPRGRRDRRFATGGLVRRTLGKIPGGGRRSASEIGAVLARGRRVMVAGGIADGAGRSYAMAAQLHG